MARSSLCRSALESPFIFIPNSTFLRNREPGKQTSSWKIRMRSVPGVDNLLSSMAIVPEVGVCKAGDQMQQGRLAAAGRADNAQEFSRLHLQVNAIEREQSGHLCRLDSREKYPPAETLGVSVAARRIETIEGRATVPRAGFRTVAREARSSGREIRVRARHCIAFFPFSASTWFSNVKS